MILGLFLLLFCTGLAAQPLPGQQGLSYRPQGDTDARGVYPQPIPTQQRSWSSQNPDGPTPYQQSWSYGYPPGRPGSAPGPFGYGQSQPPWGQPQQPGWPAAGGQPQLSWPGQKPAVTGGAGQPRVQVQLHQTQAYVHQNLILGLEIISQENLSTLAVDLPQTQALVLRELGETSAEARIRNGRREIVNRQYYQLTPMQSGDIELPPLRVSGRVAGGTEYSADSGLPIRLSIREADPSVRPWLPLTNLELDASLLNDEQVAEGQPLTLVLEQTAEGMSGNQLPSLEAQLHSPQHSVYREKTETSGRIDKQGRLIGRRMDRFTLVPQQGNRLQIPAIRLDWWNAERQRKETAIIPARLIGSGAMFHDLSDKFSDIPFVGSQGWLFWLPMIVFAFVAGLYWSWVWARSRSLGQGLRNWLVLVLHPLSSRLEPLAARLSPQRQMHRLRRLFANLLPRSFRLWYCVRAADQETDPDDWAQVLRFLLNRRLGITAQRPMAQLAEEIIRLHRPKRPEELRQLLRELEADLFSAQGQVSDFANWKRRFKRQIRPNPLRLLRLGQPRQGWQLPALNPQL
ncbi:BatD family protein [Magnetovirga frankeli]|uniref:hypothetical protein n=1 Tax=Magnetovirga frankeli TaxID=947516 RepID=UPI001AF97877|nr:BatD family protein [gamma proteobacterium SS-5]